MQKKVLVIAPHADDELIGVGGSLLYWKEKGYLTKIALVSCTKSRMRHLNGEVLNSQTRELEFLESAKILSTESSVVFDFKDQRLDAYSESKIVRELDDLLYEYKPDIYVYPEPSYHQDHMIVNRSCTASNRPTKEFRPSTVLTYEIPTSTWVGSGTPFIPNYYVDVSNYLDTKLNIFETVYKSQFTTNKRKKLANEGIKKHAQYRGLECDLSYAEAFKLLYHTDRIMK